MSLLSMCPVCRNPESMRSDCMAFEDVSRRSCPKIKFKQHAEEIQALRERAEQAEARALAAENKVAWQEVETADLRDDVKRLHKTVSECEERALENQKDAGRYRWLRDSKNAYPLFFIAQRDPHNIVVQFSGELADMNIDAAVAGAKHD